MHSILEAEGTNAEQLLERLEKLTGTIPESHQMLLGASIGSVGGGNGIKTMPLQSPAEKPGALANKRHARYPAKVPVREGKKTIGPISDEDTVVISQVARSAQAGMVIQESI